jgi:hypothetical protein
MIIAITGVVNLTDYREIRGKFKLISMQVKDPLVWR